MSQKEIRKWRKVYESDLSYVISELKESITSPAMVLLTGEVGAGKTSFVKVFIGDNLTQSPSYSMMSETPTIVHADFYRVEKVEEIIHLELGLYLEGKEFFLVEWGKKYLRTLLREIEENFNIYELEITINPPKMGLKESRDYCLFHIDRNLY